MLEVPLDKELTANCLVETRTKLEELISAVMVKLWSEEDTTPLVVAAVPDLWYLMIWFVFG